MPATCKSCGAPVTWVATRSGKKMPLDAAHVPGVLLNVVVRDGVAHVVAPGSGAYTSHFSTCPNAQEHRKNPKEEAKKLDAQADLRAAYRNAVRHIFPSAQMDVYPDGEVLLNDKGAWVQAFIFIQKEELPDG